MRKSRIFMAAILSIILTTVIGFCSYEFYLRTAVKQFALNKGDFGALLFYTNAISRTPNKNISFRFYDYKSNLVVSSDIKLNNMGYFSKYNYSVFLNDDKEIRIVVLGGEQTASSIANISWPDFMQDALQQKLKYSGYHVKVFNLGWPDARPIQYEEYLNENIDLLHPHFIVINFVETDFYREPKGKLLPVQFKGQNIQYESEGVNYRLGLSKINVITPKIGDAPISSLADPRAIPSRPFAFFATKQLIDDKKAVAEFQKTIMSDFVDGGMPRFGTLTWLKLTGQQEKFNFITDFAARRNFDPQTPQTMDMSDAAFHVHKRFRRIYDKHNNMVFVHNRSLPEILQKTRFDLTLQLKALDPELTILDAIDYLPKNQTEAEIRSWYIDPHMQEKWSQKGHKIYGEAMANLLLEQAVFQKRIKENAN